MLGFAQDAFNVRALHVVQGTAAARLVADAVRCSSICPITARIVVAIGTSALIHGP